MNPAFGTTVENISSTAHESDFVGPFTSGVANTFPGGVVANTPPLTNHQSDPARRPSGSTAARSNMTLNCKSSFSVVSDLVHIAVSSGELSGGDGGVKEKSHQQR